MTERGEIAPQGKPGPPPGVPEREVRDPVLEAKYLDFCSARVAEVLLALSADEMYVLAQNALAEASRSRDESLTYDEIVQLATRSMSQRLSLPKYRVWVEEYRSDPEKFEQELLGLWRSEVREEPSSDE